MNTNPMNTNPLIFSLSFSLLLFSGATSTTAIEELTLPRLLPTDESARDPQLQAYLSQLRTAVRKRDGQALRKLMASDILLTFGPPSEKPLEETLELMNSNSPVWNELEEVLQFGGTFTDPRHFCIPYVFAAFPDNLDAYAHQVVIKPSVIARREPNGKAPEVATLEFAIVRTNLGTPEPVIGTDGTSWITIFLGKQTAYVPQGTLRSPLEKRACFEKRQTGWVMTSFISGD